MAKILLVDDSPTQALQYQFLLEEANHTVELAEGGKEAVSKLQASLPDIVLTDLQMPDMDGLELVKHIQDKYPLVPVVLMTGNGSEAIALKALQLGAASYVPKQIFEREIVNTLKNILQVAQADQQEEKILSYRELMEEEFVLENDPELLPALISHLERELKRAQIDEKASKLRVITALREALENAVFHGNLEVSSKLRETSMPTFYKTASERRSQEPYRGRKVYLKTHITRTEIRYIVRDEGPGFDPSTIPDPTDPANIVKASGRGLLLISTFMDKVTHNKTGNEITMVKIRS